MTAYDHKVLIGKGLGHLKLAQQRDGSFLSLSSEDPDWWTKAKKYQTTFATSLILSCLNKVTGDWSGLPALKRKAADYLLTQKSDQWTFNYWARGSKEAKTMPYPDDLDDTFCALAALTEYNHELIDGAALAKIVALLTLVEEREGGPYRTWFVDRNSPPVWQDTDLAVNNNVAYFLSLQEVTLTNLVALVEEAIKHGDYRSPYYPSPYPLVYFIARWYRGRQAKKLIHFLLSRQNRHGYWENPLNSALAVSTLLRLGIPTLKVQRAVQYLVRSSRDGIWPPAAFCLDPAREGKTYYAGASTLTTAFCLEALARFARVEQTTSVSQRPGHELDVLYERIVREVFGGKNVSNEVKKSTISVLKKILEHDKSKQIVLLPAYFRGALGRRGARIPDTLLVSLGTATLYGWIAYTIYDDFLDLEGDPRMLPVANLALRRLSLFFTEAIPGKTGFRQFFNQVMDDLEGANAWESNQCRFVIEDGVATLVTIPHFGDLAPLWKKSFGHALGPLALLFSLGFKEHSTAVRQTIDFFRHYLLARQLNDDAHDWEEDLRAGRINAVGAMLLTQVLKKGSQRPAHYRIDRLIERCQKVFWEATLLDVSRRVLKEVGLARKALEENPLIENRQILDSFLVPIEGAAQQALVEHAETVKFLKAYNS